MVSYKNQTNFKDKQRKNDESNMVSHSIFAGRLKKYDPAFQFSKSTSPVLSLLLNAFKEAVVTSRRGSGGGFWGALKVNRPDMTRHGRRHKSVWGPSRRVWEATTTVFRGSTRVSRAHRSHYQNGDDRQCLFVPPSMNFVDKWTILEVKIETKKVNQHWPKTSAIDSRTLLFS